MQRPILLPRGVPPLLALGVACAVASSFVFAGCGDDGDTPAASSTSATSASTGGGGAGSGGGGAGGGAACLVTAPGPTHGSAIALSPDDKTIVVTNRDVGSVTVMRVDYADGLPKLTKSAEIDVGQGSEPVSVAIDGCGQRAYVALRKDQRIVTIEGVDGASPAKGAAVAVGSEPTGLVLSPNNGSLYVANWVEGTVSVISTAGLTVSKTVDLNATLSSTHLLGEVSARPALAHPRALAMTNDGDADDSDETVYVTEWFGQRTAPEADDGSNTDTNKEGLLYAIAAQTGEATTIALPPVAVTGFKDHNGADTGCYPNQVGAVTVEGGFVYVASTCASPKGPLGVFAGPPTCSSDVQCGAVGGVCDLGTAKCLPNKTDVKTTTHPAFTTVKIADGSASTITLDAKLDALGGTKRMPLLPSEISFFNGFGYVSSEGSDALYRLTLTDGQVTAAGSLTNDFIDMRKNADDKLIRLPVGVATAHGAQAFGFVANEGSRDVTAVSFNKQAIAVTDGGDDFRIESASALPADGTPEDHALRGKRFFTTGLGRWSLNGEAWGSCAACHVDGLTDDVTWYFNRGPRQSVSLDGSFSSKDGADRRIFNWTAIFDEVADFENNTRGVSGGLGAIVDAANAPIALAGPGLTPAQQGLQGSAQDIADPMGSSGHPHGTLNDWNDITAWIQTIRSPRRPVGLVAADVAAGKAIFADTAQGNCGGCHSGDKWTISRVFYAPGDGPNAVDGAPASLSTTSWNTNLNGFPEALLPVSQAQIGNAAMRFGAAPAAEQIQCILRPVGTFGVSPDAVKVLEKRQDMITDGQGAAETGRGFNPPSLLGVQVGAPYFHAGNARTLEELFDDALFNQHHRSAVAQVFNPSEEQKRQLVAYLLSIDEDETAVPIPDAGSTGGDLCFFP